MSTKKQPTMLQLTARIDYILKPNHADFAYYIVIQAGGQDFVGSKGYVHHKRAVTQAQKLGFKVVDSLPDHLKTLMGG